MIDLAPHLSRIPARVGVLYRDLDSGRQLEHQSQADFPAASILKVPILLEVYRRAQAGELSLGERVRLDKSHHSGGAGVLFEFHEGLEVTLEDLCRMMIVVSDNTASNLLLDRVGADAVNRLMAGLGMSGSHLGRRFMEAASAERDNRMTCADAARCLEALWRGEVLQGEWREGALAILRRQQYREKIPGRLPEEQVVAHKTGLLAGVSHDAGIVETPHPYLVVFFTEKGEPPWEVDAALAELSLALYRAHREL